MQHTYVQEADGRRSIAVFHNGSLLVATDAHPAFEEILAGAIANDEGIVPLFDASVAAKQRFERLTDRVTVENGTVYFDGDPIHNSLTEQIARFLSEGVDDWEPLVAFLENVYENPSPISRDELCDWVGNHESVTITEDGYIVGYKGCNFDSEGVPVSTVRAPESDKVAVDDEPVVGFVPQRIGSVVTMPRGVVDPDQNAHCSKGLHIGTWSYASSFARVVMEVHVHPRDIVSVTSDSNREKIRACRYEVVRVATAKHTATVIPAAAHRDTRDNHKSQERYPAGTYIGGKPVGGRFIPVGV